MLSMGQTFERTISGHIRGPSHISDRVVLGDIEYKYVSYKESGKQ